MNGNKKLFLIITILLANYFIIIVHKVQAQEQKLYSAGVAEKRSVVGFLELKTIETDPVLKLAKESVPFDREFFLKIKRNSKGKKANIGKTKTDIVETIYPSTQDTIKVSRKKVEEIKEIVPLDKQEKEPSKVEGIRLIDVKKSYVVTIADEQVYQESEDSEFIFVELNNLKPDRNYKLEITWSDKKESDNYYFTTVSPTLDKRLKQRIFSQLGVAVPIFKNGEDIFVRPSLMLGVYYNLRQVDPDIPYKSYKSYALQRFSCLFGLTINSIAEENLRTDLIGDSNILVGIGYQPLDALRISYGQILFYEMNPNRLISDRKSIVGTTYLAVTLDVKLKDIISGVITTLGFK